MNFSVHYLNNIDSIRSPASHHITPYSQKQVNTYTFHHIGNFYLDVGAACQVDYVRQAIDA